jgi:hypothetical protein
MPVEGRSRIAHRRGAERCGSRHPAACLLLALLVLLQVGVRRLSVEGSVTNSAADFLSSLQPPDPSEFRLRPDWLNMLPHDMDDTLMLAPPDLPDELQHPYFKRVDFMPAQNAAQRWIDDEHLLVANRAFRDRLFVPTVLLSLAQNTSTANRVVFRAILNEIILTYRTKPGMIQYVKHFASTLIRRTKKHTIRSWPSPAIAWIVPDSISVCSSMDQFELHAMLICIVHCLPSNLYFYRHGQNLS